MKLLDLFSGAGGFSLAFKRVFPDGEIVGFSEIDKYAIQTYEKHFPGVKNYGSITDVRPETVPDFDICSFGFPCQDLSIAGKRKGFGGQRSSLFHEAIRIINAKRPKCFVFENVKGLFSSNGGKDFIEVLQAVADIGYNGQWQMLNTKWFLPQNRERIYFVGHLREEPRPQVFPIGENAASTTLINRGLLQVGCLGKDSESTRIYDTNGIARTIKNGGGMGSKTGLYVIEDFYPDRTRIYKDECPALRGDRSGLKITNAKALTEARTEEAKKIRSESMKNGRDFSPRRGKEVKVREDNNMNAIIAGIPHLVNRIRRLTPMECERLQGFPDSWTEDVSDTQRYKLMGNAITVNLAEMIFSKIQAAENELRLAI